MKRSGGRWAELPWGLIGYFLAVVVVAALAAAIALYDPAPTKVPPVYPTSGSGQGSYYHDLSLYR